MAGKLGRIAKNKEFDNVFKKGRVSYNKLAGVRACKNELNEIRLGVMVSNKVSKKAVLRNKIRRQIREIFRLKLDKMHPGYDIVVIALPEIKEKTYQDIEAAINFNLKKIKIIK